MPIRLVTFLGTGGTEGYRETRYVLRDGSDERPRQTCQTRFIARALAELCAADEVVVLATEQARAKNGSALREALARADGPEPDLRTIPFGSSADELWLLFEAVREAIAGTDPSGHSPDHVIVDITHGFRAQPFFAAAVLAYLRATIGRSLSLRVVYGAFEDGVDGETPIWDLTTHVELIDWAQAILLFERTGRADDVVEPTRRMGLALRKAWALGGRRGEPPAVGDLADALGTFGNDLVTLRTGALLINEPGRPGSAQRLVGAVERAIGTLPPVLAPLTHALDGLRRRIEPLGAAGDRLGTPEGREAIAALARLYIDMERYAEATATLREGWVTLFSSPYRGDTPGRKTFEGDSRLEAERECSAAARRDGHSRDYRGLQSLRNDLLHAGYSATPSSPARLRDGLDAQMRAFDRAKALVGPAISRGEETSTRRQFLNLSNHPSAEWSAAQREAAFRDCEAIVDLPFPATAPEHDRAEIEASAESLLRRVPADVSVAMVQGEHTLSFALVKRLQARDIRCVAATTSREVESLADGERRSRFGFVQFRDYPELEPSD